MKKITLEEKSNNKLKKFQMYHMKKNRKKPPVSQKKSIYK